MTTAYVFKSPSRLNNFDCHHEAGLTFTSSVQDITFLDGTLFEGETKIFVQQQKHPQAELPVGYPVLWFLHYSKSSVGNVGLEQAWKNVTRLGGHLWQFTQLGQSFSYRDVWLFPNIPSDWDLASTVLEFKDKSLAGIYWDDPNAAIGFDGKKFLTLNTVNADLILAISNKNSLSQSHFVHVTIPTNIGVNAKNLFQTTDVLQKMKNTGLKSNGDSGAKILEFYNRALTADDVFQSFLHSYLIVELLIDSSTKTTLDTSAQTRLKEFMKNDIDMKDFAERIALTTPKETSRNRLSDGISKLIGGQAPINLDTTEFDTWRTIRAKIVHPGADNSITESRFVEANKSIRKFCDQLVGLMLGVDLPSEMN